MAVYRSTLPHADYTILRNCWLRDERLSLKAKGLLGYLASHAEGYKVSQAQMVRQSSDGKDAVRSGLDELEAAGYLARTSHRSAGRFAEDDYALADPFDGDGRLICGEPDHPEQGDMRITRHSGKTAAGKPLRLTRPIEDEGEKTRGEDQPLSLPLPGEEDEEPGAAAPPSRPRPPAAAAAFDEFWQAYPKKVGKDAARRAWARAVKRADPDKITAVARVYPWRDERQFVKDPARWLNEGCWEDDLDAVAAANAARSNGHRPPAGPYRDPPRDSYTAGPL